ncbi:hypothetical protein COY28_01725 [Candidatus Woesearchaeota archaeon CG_4_10_14_0_2_um_filter_57_5]|nr:MAG: hypothetical protein AUJ68_02250 [Candidatus Woesearchaeota archaeon CG1_02_57_44]PIZ55601.1 MAG: hypothetical protein COY28_01725 [Candidatus Woesearchaeota archaeon CG_4_10_14_0_2_um_filter_57_5]
MGTNQKKQGWLAQSGGRTSASLAGKKGLNSASLEREVVSCLQDLIRIPSPLGNEIAVADYLVPLLRQAGFSVRMVAADKSRPNIIASRGKGPELALCCHMDTVPAGDGWTLAPFSGQRKAGKVYGRGAVDNKGPLAATLIAGSRTAFPGKLTLVFFAEEETGSALGMQVVSTVLKPRLALIPDIGGEMRHIAVGEKGLLFVKVASIGKQAHGSSPHQGVNAIDGMMLFLSELRALQGAKGQGPCGSMATISSSTRRLFSAPTCNLGIIKGGSLPNMVPGMAEATLDFRYLPGQSRQGIIAMLRAAGVSAKRKGAKTRFGYTVLSDQRPVLYDSKVAQAATDIIVKETRRVTGRTATLKGLSGSTVGKFLGHAGVPVLGIGCGKSPQMHAADEHIAVRELVLFTRLTQAIINGIGEQWGQQNIRV